MPRVNLKQHEWNYRTHDFELVAMVFTLKILRHFLYREKCYINTDHNSHQYLPTQKDLNLREQRWVEFLKDYDLVINYHPRKSNIVVDSLSQKLTQVLVALFAQLDMVEDGVITELVVKPTFVPYLRSPMMW